MGGEGFPMKKDLTKYKKLSGPLAIDAGIYSLSNKFMTFGIV